MNSSYQSDILSLSHLLLHKLSQSSYLFTIGLEILCIERHGVGCQVRSSPQHLFGFLLVVNISKGQTVRYNVYKLKVIG